MNVSSFTGTISSNQIVNGVSTSSIVSLVILRQHRRWYQTRFLLYYVVAAVLSNFTLSRSLNCHYVFNYLTCV